MPSAAFGAERSSRSKRHRCPEQRYLVRTGREVLQARVGFADGTYLVRVFADVDRRPPEVVTVYRTGKISKYWRVAP